MQARRHLSAALLLAVLAVLAPAPGPVSAAGDPHRLFEARCGRCHAHAGGLARERLGVAAGTHLVGRQSGEDIAVFLAGHYGRLTDAEIALLVDLFRFQVLAEGKFRAKCAICHGRARDLARAFLALRDGRLVGRYTGRDVAGFLAGHGRVEPAELPVFLEALTRAVPGDP
ncbi:MAG: hypothetical protein H6907_13585 [Hyphomicrobiales bacterium]|nr:hypothetical protein [Hyphomicrobiales bacterium]